MVESVIPNDCMAPTPHSTKPRKARSSRVNSLTCVYRFLYPKKPRLRMIRLSPR